jgi:putative MFS transporter
MAVVELIAATTTKAGLKVESALDTATYEKGIKVSNAQMKTLDIQGDAFHPEWNYTIRPRPTRLEKAAKRGEPCLRLQAAAITARLDRLPASAYVWRLVVLLSLGGLFEIYDLFLTPYVMPGLIRSQIFQEGQNGLFGLPDQASFLSCTFAGLFLGTIVFASVADKFGRRVIFTYALLWYALATGIMAAQDSRGGILLWRFIAGVGIGVELVTIDTYISELVPKSIRGRAFAINQAIQFVAVPLATFLSWQLVPIDPLVIAGWRWVVAVPVLGALFVWWIRREVPESPRWLAQHGRPDEADRVTAKNRGAGRGRDQGRAAGAAAWRGRERRRRIFRDLEASLSAAHHHAFRLQLLSGHRLLWLRQLGAAIAHRARHERRQGPGIWRRHRPRLPARSAPVQPVRRPSRTEMADLLRRVRNGGVRAPVLDAVRRLQPDFARHPDHDIEQPPILCLSRLPGRAVPDARAGARAVGFVYSFSRISTAFNSYMIAFFLLHFGSTGVFSFIAFAMAMVILVIGAFGPRTNNRALEEISQAA